MILLIDTNIILDFLLKRSPFYESAKEIMRICSREDVNGIAALHTITNIWYILRKLPDETRRSVLISICELLHVVGTSHSEVVNALKTSGFKDFEDCVQTKCAQSSGADYIITRNKVDFELSDVPVLTPDELMKRMQ